MHTESDVRRLDKSEFPALLTQIPDAPKQLWVRGMLPSTQSHRYLAVVGSREYTPYGKACCQSLIMGLRGYAIVIVSGLALGIDGIAHEAALTAGLTTLAVPGSGLDDRVLYPAAHRNLAHRILQAGGVLVSEFDPMWRPRPESFPQRNRIMAGMCNAVLVIEATQRSGTLITSRLAAEYNRDVFAVPGPIHSRTSEGPHLLIQKGAALISSSADILRALDLEPTSEHQPRQYSDLTEREQHVVTLLTKHALPRDELIKGLGCSISEANVLFSSLELRGIIHESLGKFTLTQ